jgi:DNA topoisomerase VI subunit B
MEAKDTFSIRPAGRHILTIGRELIQDRCAAVIELVKNAYDADSPDVIIDFHGNPDKDNYSIIITDHGHGMSRDTVLNKWMVPSTDDKLKRRTSPAGRLLQGNKGIGRYASAILGDDLLLETTTPDGEKTTVCLVWQDFEKAKYLDNVEVLIETIKTNEPAGTILRISGDKSQMNEWNKEQFDKLQKELKKLTSPLDSFLNPNDPENFSIKLIIKDFQDIPDTNDTIKPYPIFDLYDYMIKGTINPDGKGVLSYSMQKARNTTVEKISFDNNGPTECGKLIFDIRVYDREKEAIESMIARGLKNDNEAYVGKIEARQLLNTYNGIGVYRNGFRIRPLGDPDFDWLKLNEQRVQNPSMRIGSNQVIGYIQIESEDRSGLIEKSARDGLKDNPAFAKLKDITKNIIIELEKRRFIYREKTGLGRKSGKIEPILKEISSSNDLKTKISSTLSKFGLDKSSIDNIQDIIDIDTARRNETIEKISQAVAVYQGQATLGKIIGVILHEGRRPLNYFKNNIPNLQFWYDSYNKSGDVTLLGNFLNIAKDFVPNVEFFVTLFGRLDPLAAGKRSEKKDLLLKDNIESAFTIFSEDMKTHSITYSITGPSDFKLRCWKQDIYSIFTNLIDNSIYWMNEKNTRKKEIKISILCNKTSLLYIDYQDTGPGIEPSLIESGVIFEPSFSTKPEGTGLGLAIAGESASRNGLELKAMQSETGAYFRLESQMEH